jgi:hypothetical protein
MIFRMINLCAIVDARMVLHDGQVTLRTFHCRNTSANRVAIICVGIGVHMIDFFNGEERHYRYDPISAFFLSHLQYFYSDFFLPDGPWIKGEYTYKLPEFLSEFFISDTSGKQTFTVTEIGIA